MKKYRPVSTEKIIRLVDWDFAEILLGYSTPSNVIKNFVELINRKEGYEKILKSQKENNQKTINAFCNLQIVCFKISKTIEEYSKMDPLECFHPSFLQNHTGKHHNTCLMCGHEYN